MVIPPSPLCLSNAHVLHVLEALEPKNKFLNLFYIGAPGQVWAVKVNILEKGHATPITVLSCRERLGVGRLSVFCRLLRCCVNLA